MKIYATHIVFFLMFCHGAMSQRSDDFIKFTKKDGLSSSMVYSVVQDKRGKLWLGTGKGLDFFDGIHFHSYIGGYNCTLPAASIYQLLLDKEENIWVLTSDNQVGIFDPLKLMFIKANLPGALSFAVYNDNRLYIDSKDNVFLIINTATVLMYNRHTNSFTEKNLPFKMPPNWFVHSLFEDQRTGNYWISGGRGVAIYNAKKNEVEYNEHNPEHLAILDKKRTNVINFFIDSKGKYWFYCWNGIIRMYSYSRQENRIDSELSIQPPMFLWYVCEQKRGDLWFYGIGDIYHRNIKNAGFNKIKNPGLVHEIKEDREGNLWLATDDGLLLYTPDSDDGIKKLLPPDKQIEVSAVYQLSNGNTLAGSWGNGILTLDSNLKLATNNFFANNARRDNNYNLVWNLTEDPTNHNIWSACQYGRIIVFNPLKHIKTYLHPDAFSNYTTTDFKWDKNGNLWFSTFNGSIIKWTRSHSITDSDFKTITNLNCIINSILIDSDDHIWVSTNGKGLFVLDGQNGNMIEHYVKSGGSKSIFNNNIKRTYQYNDSIYFVISNYLNIINTRSKKIIRADSINTNFIDEINLSGLDKDKILWLFGDQSFCKYDYKRNTVIQYSSEQNNLPPASLFVAYTLSDNRMLLGGPNKLLLFDPSQIRPNQRPPDVEITLFQLFSRYLPVDSLLKKKQVDLPYDQNTFNIYFSCFRFSDRNKISYYYKLQGLDREWVKANALAYCNYNAVAPGHYTLLLKAVNNEGIASAGITSLSIYIHPPFWETWWFTALLALCLAGVIYYIYRIRINRLLAVQKIRAKVARDLHDDVGSTLTTINILSELAKSRNADSTSPANELIEKISENSSRMMEAMGDIVWSINPANDNMKKIIARMREYAVTLLEAKGIEFAFSVDPTVQELALSIEARLDFYLIFKESVNNLVKYSGCTYVSMEIANSEKQLLLRIQDNGRGFDMNNYKKGNGLANMRRRARNIGGIFEMNSTPGSGTRVLLRVPVQNR